MNDLSIFTKSEKTGFFKDARKRLKGASRPENTAKQARPRAVKGQHLGACARRPKDAGPGRGLGGRGLFDTTAAKRKADTRATRRPGNPHRLRR